jgi:hypothetical protein
MLIVGLLRPVSDVTKQKSFHHFRGFFRHIFLPGSYFKAFFGNFSCCFKSLFYSINVVTCGVSWSLDIFPMYSFVCALFNDINSLDYIVSSCGIITENELERMWIRKKILMAKFEVLSWHSAGGLRILMQDVRIASLVTHYLNLQPPKYKGVLPTQL